jgi:glycosyltransferase involved in cell wall biosynthesis
MTEDHLLVSIITPSYNQARFLSETIRSVLAQDHPPNEYIVIDGGSTDNSTDIIKSYQDRLAYWVSEPDNGQAQAINKGFRLATGSVFAWLNSDDTYHPGAVGAAVTYLDQHPEIDVIYGDIEFVDASGKSLSTMRAWEFDPQLQMCATNLIPQPAAFFRRSMFEQVGGLDETFHLALDYDLWVRMLAAGARFAHVHQVWATYRVHPASKTDKQAEFFASEVKRSVDRTFASGQMPPSWRSIANSNVEQLIAESHGRLGHSREARQHYWRAVRLCPWRLKSIGLLAYVIDDRLGRLMRRIRWRLAGRADEPWQSVPKA